MIYLLGNDVVAPSGDSVDRASGVFVCMVGGMRTTHQIFDSSSSPAVFGVQRRVCKDLTTLGVITPSCCSDHPCPAPSFSLCDNTTII